MGPIGLVAGGRCDGISFGNGLADALTLLERRVGLIDALNVFPVPDGDTGTNLTLTMRVAVQAARSGGSADVGSTMAAAARGALAGAHGNSGVILSQFFHGFARSLEGCDSLDSLRFARALDEGARAASASVDRPVEGTILTVARDAARVALRTAESGAPLVEVVSATAKEACASVERTRGAFDALRQADVVDAGALGLATIFEGIAYSLRGDPLPSECAPATRRPAAIDMDAGQYGYCTEFVLRGSDLVADQIHRDLRVFGDSILAVGDSSMVRVHLHTFRPGDVVEYSSSLGSVHELKIDDMQSQNRRLREHGSLERERVACNLLVIVDGDGFGELFRSLGALVIPDWRQLPVIVATAAGLIRTTDADDTIVLIDDPERASEINRSLSAPGLIASRLRTHVTDNPARSVAAALAFRPDRTLEENLRTLNRAMSGVRCARIRSADRAAGVAGPRDVSGILDDGGRLECGDLATASVCALRQLGASEREIITLYHGRDVSAQDQNAVAEALRGAFPAQRVEAVVGGQTRDLICLSCE